MITTANLAELRPLNFGIRTLRAPPTVDVLAREVARYDAADAAAVSRQVRAGAGHDALVDELIGLYEAVLAERIGVSDDPAAESRAASRYLQRLSGPLVERDRLEWLAVRVFRLPLVNRLLRRRAARERPGHPLPELLKAFDRS
jgi:hypothetical protein